MSYNKRTWANGNVVGAVDLNRMEQGIEEASGGSNSPFYFLYYETDQETGVSQLVGRDVFGLSGETYYVPIDTWEEFVSIISSGKYQMSPIYSVDSSSSNVTAAEILEIGNIDIENQRVTLLVFDYNGATLACIRYFDIVFYE